LGIRAVFGEHDEKTLVQLRDVAGRAEHAALMADGHLGYVMPIGGVAAYRDQVSVVGVGFDIACGNAAILTDMKVDGFSRQDLEVIADEIQRTISFGMGRNNAADDAPVNDPLFEAAEWGAVPREDRQSLHAKARNQLGTVGSGNHYVDVFADELGRIWVGVHFGSRGFGHTVASGFLSLAAGKKFGERVPETECLLPLDTALGADYWGLMNLAGRYAYAGREWVARKVVSILGGNEAELVHNHHNCAWREEHFGESYIVVRKGATPAFPGQRGFVGGSMGDNAVIVEGVDSPRSPDTLYSTVHGAGRVMSRTEAAGKVKRRTVWGCGNHRNCDGWLPMSAPKGEQGANPKCPKCGVKTHRRQDSERVREGRISWDMLSGWLGPKGIILRGGGLDEAPQAYRRLPDVLAAQGDTIRVLHTLTPLVVVMAGENEYDPYKD
jgi:tRNA-splicing ligase RtcB (3'-phosphate/5'-hydroxy nucleic acid ligase)